MNKILIIIPLILSGCIADQRTDQKGGEANTSGPTINIPPAQTVDTEKLEKNIGDKIIASSNTTQNQLAGLLTTSVSKVGERVTGLEANLSELIKLNATMNNTAQVEVKAKLDATISLTTQLKAEMNNMVNISNKIEAHLTALTDIKVELGKINTQAQGQVGWNNKLENKIEDIKQTFTSTAGRDVNNLPKQAVDIIIGSWEFFAILISILCGAATTIISYSYKLARERSDSAAKLERQSHQNTYKLLLSAISHCPLNKQEEIKKAL